jgi:hypothetical protein
MSETLFVRIKIRTQTERHIKIPRVVDSLSSCALSVRESGDTSRGSGVCLFSIVNVLGDEDSRGVLSERAPLVVIMELEACGRHRTDTIQGACIAFATFERKKRRSQGARPITGIIRSEDT